MKTGLIGGIVALAFAAVAAPASATVINFDDLVGGTNLTNGTNVTNQYAGLGVTFDDGGSNKALATLGTTVAATGSSSPNVLFVQQNFFAGPALRINFLVAVQAFTVTALQSSGYQLTLAAYTSGGALLQSVTFPGDPTYGAPHVFGLSEGSNIGYVLASSNAGGNFSLDDLTFNGGATGGVTEPAAWALLIVGFGGVGAAARRRRTALAA